MTPRRFQSVNWPDISEFQKLHCGNDLLERLWDVDINQEGEDSPVFFQLVS